MLRPPATGARRGSPDPAETADRRSPADQGDLRSGEWLGQETGHSSQETGHSSQETSVTRLSQETGHSSQETGHSSDVPHDIAKRQRLEQFALTNAGNADLGRKLFADEERTQCLTCHRVNQQGGNVGPDLSMIGGKFDRPHLIESLLQPSQLIVEGYRTTVIVTVDGRIHTGIVKAQDEEQLTLVDAKSNVSQISVSDIDEREVTSLSVMPVGLADALSADEFTNLIAYLETLRPGGKPEFGSGITGPIELPDGFEITTVTTGLTGATALETTSDGRVFVCEQTGQLRVIKEGKLLEKPFVTIPVDDTWERGLIGVTVAPDFPLTPYVYVCYVAAEPYPHHRISRFRADGDVAAAESEEILLRGDDQRKLGGNVPAGHQGGGIHFGTDGKLYVGIGEQTAEMPAQRLDTFQGKLLRINPNGSIPADNPFLDQTDGKYGAIWAIGCRNPFTFSVQQSTGLMFVNDVGGKFEEINRGIAGANYGWPVIDHGPTNNEAYVGPVHIYPQASIAGGDFAPDDLPWPKQYRGRYFFADFVLGWIKALDPASPSTAETFATGLRRPVDLRFAPDGSLYVLLRNAWVIDGKFEGSTGSLLRIRPKD